MVLLSSSQANCARSALRRASVHYPTDSELAALIGEHGVELALLQGDLEAGDFSLFDRPTLDSGIAFHQHHLAEATKQAERRLRARRFAQAPSHDGRGTFPARFDAMRVADIVDAIQTLGTPLQKRGREWWGLCPFHQDRTPSFAVNAEKGVWRCHGCQRGGDLVGFAMERQHLNAVDALRFLEVIIDVPGVAA